MRLLHEGALRNVVSSGESLPAFVDYLTQLRSERDAAILYCFLIGWRLPKYSICRKGSLCVCSADKANRRAACTIIIYFPGSESNPHSLTPIKTRPPVFGGRVLTFLLSCIPLALSRKERESISCAEKGSGPCATRAASTRAETTRHQKRFTISIFDIIISTKR